MALTQAQLDATNEILRQLNEEVGGILHAREDVHAAIRLDTVDDANIEALNIIVNAKARAAVHAIALATLLAP
jgi:hypothetical protein